MRILYVVPYTPNLIRVRPYNLIRSLSARGHEVTVLTQYSSAAEKADAAALQAHCQRVIALPLARWRSLWNCLVTLPGGVPLQSAYCWQPALAAQLDGLVEQQNGRPPFDVIHVEHLRGARYGLHLKRHWASTARASNKRPSAVRPPVVWDSVDCISLLFRRTATQSQHRLGRWMARFELARTERFEGWAAQQFDHVLLTSAADQQALAALLPHSPASPAAISVLANGVDAAYFQPAADVAREPATIALTGKMSYHANVTMALFLMREVMPTVWAQRPDVKVSIVGKDPTREICALAENPAVTVTGTVSDIRPYLQRATIAAVPIAYGAGIQNKVLEAMACGTPVVATPQAVAALAAVPNRDLLVAGLAGEGKPDGNGMAQAILSLLGDPHRQTALGAAGRAYIQTHHNWENIAAQLEGIYHAIVYPHRRNNQQAAV
jgi:glycosyltransferase involved in cell wall biosynthesis